MHLYTKYSSLIEESALGRPLVLFFCLMSMSPCLIHKSLNYLHSARLFAKYKYYAIDHNKFKCLHGTQQDQFIFKPIFYIMPLQRPEYCKNKYLGRKRLGNLSVTCHVTYAYNSSVHSTTVCTNSIPNQISSIRLYAFSKIYQFFNYQLSLHSINIHTCSNRLRLTTQN